jgi:hypothetical protein
LIFSTIYTLVFFMSIGCMSGSVEKLEFLLEKSEIEMYERSVRDKLNIPEDFKGDFIEELR